ncbi:pentapeptide repeat-containing protein [Coraliomargarita parva]|uniref:pentapeptide repeat-containing protein n=1 Tax=Coraliomargarita parva TaxID=3014050 RepID=UPI0022B50DE5|nr:pentapeptide repeat-containing protein [Coraliomargarita parva]
MNRTPFLPRNRLLSLAILTVSNLSALTTIDVDTIYTGQDFSGESLSAAASDLGSTHFFGGSGASNLSNTSWSGSGATVTPHFSNLDNQNFRLVNFTGANWSGVHFTSTSGLQVFQQTKFTNANFSGASFTLTTGLEMFKQADFSGADFSGAMIDVGSTTDFLKNATFSSSTNFSGATIYAGDSVSSGSLPSLSGANFSGATLRIDLEGTDLSGVNFQNASFIKTDGIGSVIRNSVANLTDFRGTDFTGVNFSNWIESLTWDEGMAPLYDDNTIFTTQSGTFDPVAAGWTYSPVPEPAAFALMGGALAFAGVMLRRRLHA